MKCIIPKFTVLSVSVLALALASTAPVVWAEDDDDDNEIPFAEAHLFFELNNTDGDLGIHALIDGEPWKKLEIEDPRERKMLDVRVSGRLQRQGLTEIFFESAEPTFDELSPKRFFGRFREGIYEIEGKTLDGKELESEVELTHVMPAPPEPLVNGTPMSTQCTEEEFFPTVINITNDETVTISWAPVEMSHDDPNGGGAAVQPPVPVNIHNYEVVVEVEVDVNGEEFASVMHVVLPPGETSLTLPEQFLAQGEEFKYEVLAREESFNQTAVESCFIVE